MIVPTITNRNVAFAKVQNGEEVSNSLVKEAGYGDKVDLDRLKEILDNIEKLVPPNDATKDDKNLFDKNTAIELHKGFKEIGLDKSALHMGPFWEWISLKYQPLVVKKRWPQLTKNRFIYGRRHCHFHLWQKADILFDESSGDPYHYLNLMFESELGANQDLMVQIFERSYSGYSIIVKAIVSICYKKKFVDNLVENLKINFRKFYRELSMIIQHRQPVYCFADINFDKASSFIKFEADNVIQKLKK